MAGSAASATSPATLAQVTHLSYPDYTRVVLELDRHVTWQANRLPPEPGQKGRIYIDLAHTQLGEHAASLTIGDQLLAAVRIGQYQPDVVRVVLDTARAKNYKIYPLANPARLFIVVWDEQISDVILPEQFESQGLSASDGREAKKSILPAPASPAPLPLVKKSSAMIAQQNQAESGSGSQKATKKASGHAETFLLDVTVNSILLPEIVRAERLADGRLVLPLSAWQAARLLQPATEPLQLPDQQQGYALESVPELTYSIDPGRLTLKILAPAAAFAGSSFDSGRGGEAPPNLSPLGVYVNYDANSTTIDNRFSSYGALVEGVAFSRWGSAVAGIRLRGDRDTDEVIRTETFWRKDLPGAMETLVLGDTVGSGGAWSRPVRYGGIRWSRDFALRPGFITTPMPSLSGSAALPSTVDVLINNQRQQRAQVEPGPFELRNIPVSSGSGEINLVVRDLLGRETVISQSYYRSSRLLAAGLADFSLEAGALRENFGQRSNDYGEGFAAGTWRYGLTSAQSGEVRVELQGERQAAGVELTSLVGLFGTVQAAAAFSSTDEEQGGHYLLGLERSTRRGSGSLNWEYFDREFVQFAAHDQEDRPRQRFSAGFGLPLFRKASAGVNYTSQSVWGGDRFTIAAATLGIALPWEMNLSVYASKRLDRSDDWTAGAGLSMPLGRQGSVSASTRHSRDGRAINILEVSQSLPAGPGFGWRLKASDDPSQQWQAGLSWNSNVSNLNAEISDTAHSQAMRLGANGSFGLLAGLPFATRSIGQGSFAVVKVGDLRGVPVYRSNQLAATTNASGLALVPGLLPYQKNQLTIDPTEIPFDTEIRGIKETAFPYARSGVVINFPVRRTRNALVLLRQPNGTPVPLGARVTVLPSGEEFFVGKRGEAYLMDLADRNRLAVQWREGACQLTLPLDPKGPSEPRIGPLTCGEEP